MYNYYDVFYIHCITICYIFANIYNNHNMKRLIILFFVLLQLIGNSQLCSKASITLEAIDDHLRYIYEWTDSKDIILGNGLSLNLTGLDEYSDYLYKLKVYENSYNEKVIDGDFENVGYTESYNRKTQTWKWTWDKSFETDYKMPRRAYGLINPEGTCIVAENPNRYHGGFSNMYDHTKGNINGKMLIVNGGNNLTDRVWYEKINIIPNATYIFSAWVSTLANSNPAQLSFFISKDTLTDTQIINNTNNNRIGPNHTLTTNADGIWHEIYDTWSSKDYVGDYYLTIVNQQTAPTGNDFAIDDISFSISILKETRDYTLFKKIKTNPITRVAN